MQHDWCTADLPASISMINIRLSRETGLQIRQILSFSEEVHVQNKSNFHWSLTIGQRRCAIQLSASIDDLKYYKIDTTNCKISSQVQIEQVIIVVTFHAWKLFWMTWHNGGNRVYDSVPLHCGILTIRRLCFFRDFMGLKRQKGPVKLIERVKIALYMAKFQTRDKN